MRRHEPATRLDGTSDPQSAQSEKGIGCRTAPNIDVGVKRRSARTERGLAARPLLGGSARDSYPSEQPR